MVEIAGITQPYGGTKPIARIEDKNNIQSQNSTAPSFTGKIVNFPPVNVSKSGLDIKTKLSTQQETAMYNTIVQVLSTSQTEQISPQDRVSRLKKTDALLKNGTLLNNKSNDGTSTLENLYKIATEGRGNGFDNAKILGQTIDTLYKPEIVTQIFGDIPNNIKMQILQDPELDPRIKQDPSLLDVTGSGTCVSASFEYHLARKHPAEFSRWVAGLTSPEECVEQKVKSSSLNSSYLEAYNILKNMFEIKPHSIDFNSMDFDITLRPDKNARIRAQVQDKCWDKGERSIIDVLMQSTFMQMGSEQTYNSLIDKREGKFNSNPEGLGEFEKIFIESVIENNERLSMVYQKVDGNQNLVGWGCDLKTIQKHITDTIDSGEDVVIGYVLTNETSGNTRERGYVNTPDNAPNKIVNGHEITIVDYKQDKHGNTIFICNDTDDNLDELVEYKADYLLPKIHHAGYPAQIVADDYDKIASEIYSINTAA